MAILAATNPNPARITNAWWKFACQWCALSADIELGGVYAPKPGFHSSRAENQARWPNDYSIRSLRNQRGPSDKAAAGDFTYRSAQSGKYDHIALHSSRLHTAGRLSDPRVKGWFEFFGNTDSDSQVEGRNFQETRDASSDSSHLWHIHLSELREMVACWLNKEALLSVVTGETLGAYTARHVAVWPAFGGVTLRTDTWGAPVYLAQRVLGVDADGEFGPATLAAVLGFQAAALVDVDGEVGPQTWAALGTHVTKESGMAFMDDPDASALAWRVDALFGGSETIRGGEYKGKPMAAMVTLNKIARDVAELRARRMLTAEQLADLKAALLESRSADPA
jgi:peptidoglycan hydrolase-like protein with peptidoglycan-binding domain